MRGQAVGKAFEILDHTADTGILAHGADLKQVFANAALALTSLIVDLDQIETEAQRGIEISAEDEEILLVEWLNEIIYIFDVESMVFNRFDIEDLTLNHVRATCHGETIRAGKHVVKTGVKAATYHMLNIGKSSRGYEARVILDI